MEQHEVNTAREVVCRCEEVTREELLEAMRLGADSLDSIKKRTRAGMGFCQGRTCRKLIARMLAEYYSQPADSYLPGSIRLPVAPVKLGLIAETDDAFCSCKSKEE